MAGSDGVISTLSAFAGNPQARNICFIVPRWCSLAEALENTNLSRPETAYSFGNARHCLWLLSPNEKVAPGFLPTPAIVSSAFVTSFDHITNIVLQLLNILSQC